jgi:MoaA/NifB/PqqE/SkfB family radical SAM enzyme
MRKQDIIPVWGSILRGRKPFLSVEITRECPLQCPGCYAYQPEHLGAAGPLRQLGDLKGEALVAGVLALVRRFRPLHLSIVGGEPLVRYRELDVLLPQLDRLGVEVQVVTSAVRPIPAAWRQLPNLHLAVSVDGLQPEHDRRRAPATYDRILKHIAGHRINVHCTITRQLLQRHDYLRDFADFWSEQEEVLTIWFSLYTPQAGEQGEERLTPEDRRRAIEELARLRVDFRKVEMPDRVLGGFVDPPSTPQECVFAQTTACVSADLTTRITPCQFGGSPVCAECGCIASAGLASFGRYKLAGLVPISDIFHLSKRVGEWVGGEPVRDSASLSARAAASGSPTKGP